MNISKLAVKRPVTITMFVLIAILLGVVSLTRLPIDLLPKIEVPVSIVSTQYRGVGPQEMEKLVTKPLEQSIATVGNIKNISSVSSEGSSVVIAEFNFGTDMDFAALEMREKVDLVKGYLPDGATSPMVLKIDPNAMPIMQLSVSGNKGLADLQTVAEDSIKPKLDRLEGVASVDIVGGYEKIIDITTKEEKLKGYGLSLNYLAQIIGAENLNLPAGEVKKGNKGLSVRTIGEFSSIDKLKTLPIPLKTGGTVKLKDIADINIENKNTTSLSKTNGKESITITIQKQSGTNTVNVADTVREEVNNLNSDINGGDIDIVMDQSEFIKLSINNVVKNAILGAILAIIILYIFLRNIRTTIIIGTAIPVSVITTFVLIYFNDITLNLMTLGGLALGVGMLVDNAIVVLENIYRYRQDGYSRKESAIKGAKEVGMAVTASTLTTIAVFLPIVFVEGIASTIFKELALTVTMALIASLLISLTLIPMLSSKFLKVDNMQGKKHNERFRLFSFLYDLFDKIFAKVERGYKRLLEASLNHKIITIVIAIAIFGGSVLSIFSVGAEFFPQMDQGQFNINISLPVGSELDDTNKIVSEIEEKLLEIEEVDIVMSDIGSGGAMSMASSGSTNRATLSVTLKDLDERDRTTTEVSDEVRKLIYDIPGAEKSVEVMSMAMMGGMGSAPLNINIKGDDLDTLKKISEDFKEIVKSVEGTREAETALGKGIPELVIRPNRNKTSQYGLTAAQIAGSIRSTLSGKMATRYKLSGDEIDVLLKGDERFKESISNLKQATIDTPMGTGIPLEEIAEVEIERGPVSIRREDQVRVVSVSSQILGRDLGSITEDIEAKIEEYNMPKGYSYEFTGENKEIEEAFSDLALALILAVVLVYMILASQFESLVHPLTIMLSVPISFAGGALGLFLTGNALSVPALIGFIILAGIVVNNAIVLVDYINTRRKNGESRRKAILNSGPIRLRPLAMTTLTTVLGLFPLALGLGEGSEVQAPLAISVIGGLLLSTLLTLVFVPVMYTVFDKLKLKKNG